MNLPTAPAQIALTDLSHCFEGLVPAVIATASASGAPNVTYLSRVRLVDDERIALSNQFFSKTARNLSENPRASVLVIEPDTYDEYRLTVVFERTDRRGPVFEALRVDVDVAASAHGMQEVFKLRAADIYRVVEIERVTLSAERPAPELRPSATAGVARGDSLNALATLSGRMSRSSDLNTLVDVTVNGLAELLGYEHSLLMLVDETGERLYTLASHGYDVEGVGSEVRVGEGLVGLAAERCTTVRVGNVAQMERYSVTVRRSFESAGSLGASGEAALPGLPDAASVLVVPAVAMGELVGVIVVESPRAAAFGADDESVIASVASTLAAAVESARARDGALPQASVPPAPKPSESDHRTTVRFFVADGSTFVDGDYLIKGVAGRILWSLLAEYERDARIDFTNREVRLDPSLELPEFRDNFESRLILLKRRLDERDSPIRIEKTGRGRFRLRVSGELNLEQAGAPTD